jgi:rRNA-processing protein EBP2
MVTKSKLRLALAAEKGVDFAKLKQKKKEKAALKQKALDGGAESDDEAESVNGSEEDSEEEVAQVRCPYRDAYTAVLC